MKEAQDKFYEKLEELNLVEEWEDQGCMGRIGKELEDRIVIMVHEDVGDAYTYDEYKSFKELKNDKEFCKSILTTAYDEWDDVEYNELVDWIFGENEPNPLDPVDIYFHADSFYHITFKAGPDSPMGNKEEKKSQTINELDTQKLEELYNDYCNDFFKKANLDDKCKEIFRLLVKTSNSLLLKKIEDYSDKLIEE